MSINDKMTAIAERIRNYTEKTEKLSLDKIEASIDEVYEKGKREGYYNGAFDFGNKATVTGLGLVTAENVHSIPHKIRITVSDEDLTDVTVTRMGKNLFDDDIILNADNWLCENGYYFGNAVTLRNFFHPSYSNNSLFNSFKPNTQYTFSLKAYNDIDEPVVTIGFFFRYSDGTTTVQYIRADRSEIDVSLVSKTGKDVVGLYATFGTNNCTTYLKDLQLEEGTEATEYFEYIEDTFNVNNEGKAENIISLAPIMHFAVNKETAEITVEYLKENQ